MNRQQSTQSVGSALKKIESYQYPNTHAGHLNESQVEALESFKVICEKNGYFKPGSASRKQSHDNETLLRYLRARKFVPEDAFQQFKETEDWRKQNEIDNLYETIDIDAYDETRRLYPQWTGRRDKRGIPVYVYEVAPLNSKRMASYEKSIEKVKGSGSVSPKLLRLFALYENLLRFTMPLCSAVPNRPYPETPVSQSNNIVDIAGVGLKQFWNLRQHMQDASTLATAHYPETLDRIFIIGAPSFFPTVWSWIKAWFDPITVSKIFILSKANMQSTLAQYIDPANIPRKYGGTLDWEWGSLPSLEPAISDALQWENPTKTQKGENGFPAGPVKWKEGPDGEMVAHAVGSVNGAKRDQIIARLPIRDPTLNLGPNISRMSTALQVPSYDPDIPTTTGTHTHPSDTEEYFPTTGVTPPEEHDEASLASSMQSGENKGAVPVDATRSELASGTLLQQGSAPSDTDPRSGTSSQRFEAQEQTLASGQLASGTPSRVQHGDGDRVAVVEPSTVGQAPKALNIPDADDSTHDAGKGYLQQAKDAAGGAYTAAAGAGTAMLSAVGMGGAEAGSADASLAEKTKAVALGDSAGTSGGEQEPAAPPTKEDPRVDAMPQKDVEDFLRSKYAQKPAGNHT